MSPYACVTCGIKLKTQREWREATLRQREEWHQQGFAAHSTLGRCGRCYAQARRGGIVWTRPRRQPHQLSETEVQRLRALVRREWERSRDVALRKRVRGE